MEMDDNYKAEVGKSLQMGAFAIGYLQDRGLHSDTQIQTMLKDGSLFHVARQAMEQDKKYLAQEGFTPGQIDNLGALTAIARNTYDSNMVNPTEFCETLQTQESANYHPANDTYETLDARANDAKAVTADASPLEEFADEATSVSKSGRYASLISAAKQGVRVAACLALAAGVGYAAVGGATPAYGGIIMNEDLGSQTIYNDALTNETSLNYTLNLGDGETLNILSQLSQESGKNIFDYTVINASGDEIFKINFFGEDWVSARSYSENWSVAPMQGFIEFSDNQLFSGNSDEFILGSSLTDSWGIGSADFYLSDHTGPVQVGVLKPTTVPEPATLALLLLGAGFVFGKKRR